MVTQTVACCVGHGYTDSIVFLKYIPCHKLSVCVVEWPNLTCSWYPWIC